MEKMTFAECMAEYSLDENVREIDSDVLFYLAENADMTTVPRGLVVDGGRYPVEPSWCMDNCSDLQFPPNLTINGNFNITDLDVKEFPENLTINGDLIAYNAPIEKVPLSLKVSGSIYLSGSMVEDIPDEFTCSGDLDLGDCSNLKQLPKKLKVANDLDISYTGVIRIPDDTVIGGSLHLGDAPIIYFPRNFHIPGNLYTYNDLIVLFIPDDMVVDGKVGSDFWDAPLQTFDEFKNNPKTFNLSHDGMYKYLKDIHTHIVPGDFIVENCDIEYLPDDFTVKGNLKLMRSGLKKVPKNLVVYGDLDLRYTEIPKELNDITVQGNLNIIGTDVDSILESVTVYGDIITHKSEDEYTVSPSATIGGEIVYCS